MAFSSLYSEADWATREYAAPKVQDIVFNSNATFSILKQNLKVVPGGTTIDGFAMYKKGTQGGWIGKSDTYTQAYEQKFDAARWAWKILTEPVALFVQDILENQGNEQRRFDLVMNENMNAAKTMADNVGDALYSLDYSLTSQIDSLDHAISDQTGTGDETSFSATYANVARAATGDTAGWNANIDDATTTLSVGALNDLWLDCSEGSTTPTLITSNNKAASFYYDELTPIQRQQTDDLLGKAGFTAYFFNGAPWVIDSHVPSSDRTVPSVASGQGTAPSSEYVYMMHTPTVQVHALKGAVFDYHGVMQPIDQWAVIGRYFASLNVPVFNPRFCGKMAALTA
jgi:hypothetical protein